MPSKADQEVIAGGMEYLTGLLGDFNMRQTRSATKNQGGPSHQQKTNPTPSSGNNKASGKSNPAAAKSKGKAVAIRATASQGPGEPESPRTRATTPEHEDPDGDNQPEGGDQPEEDVQPEADVQPEEDVQPEHEVQLDEHVQPEHEVQLDEHVQPEQEVQLEEEGQPHGEEQIERGKPPEETNSHLTEIQRLERLLELERQKQDAETLPVRTEVVHNTTGATSHQNKGAGPGRENVEKRKNDTVGKGLTKPTDGAIKKQAPAKQAPAKQAPAKQRSMAQHLIARGFEKKAQTQEDLDMEKKKAIFRHALLNDRAFLELLELDGELRDGLVQTLHQIDPDITSVPQPPVPAADISMASEPLSRPSSNATMASAPDFGLQASGETPNVGAPDPPQGQPGNQQQGNQQSRFEPPQQAAEFQQQGHPHLRASEPPQPPPGLQQQRNPQSRASEPPRQAPSRQQAGPSRSTKAQISRLRTVWFRDPETLQWTEAEIYGRMRQKGRMAVQLPSLNPDYPDCLRRYNVWCKDYDVKWNTLMPLAGKADLMRLLEIKENQDCYGRFDSHRPDVTGIIRSLAGALLQNLELDLPPGKEWHSITDSQRAFGDYGEQIQVYRYKSGETTPKLPLPVHQREYLESLAMRQEGVAAALENLDREREQELAKIKEMGLKLRQKHVHDILTAELQARQGWGQGSGESEGRSREVPPRPVGGHQDPEEDEIT